ncbi:hypothetical protein [Methylibium sp.]|uniref:hypothetical protein n=1 Tax=Methylibium sp. TaxID=2067992 RepID=UPI003D14C81A
MEMPSVVTTLRDAAADVTYNVRAYRKLSRQELLQSVGLFLGQRKRKKLKRGTVITIITVIGASD